VNALLEIGLSNAVQAAVLVPAVVLLGWCFRRRPAVVHALWVLVLLKLLTPSLVRIYLPWTTPAGEPPPTVAALPADVPAADTTQPLPPHVVPAHASPGAPSPVSWRDPVAIVWLGGAAVWWGLALSRIVQFRWLLRRGGPDPELRERVARLAERFGLRRVPDVWLVPAARISPMLWAPLRTARLLLPADLLDELTVEQQDAILAHELAHLLRGDPWVRRLELLVGGLYWWHPAVWWARREIEAAEEQCCDAWVAWALPESGQAYATALLSTVTYLSGRRPPLPTGATGVGHVRTLKRRLAMIVNGTTTGAAATALPRMVLLAGAVGLLWLPTWAQGDPQDRNRGSAPKVERLPTPVVKAATPSGEPPAPKPLPPKPDGGFTIPGTVQVVRSMILSPAVAGRVANIHVEVGATVKKSDLLVELDAERAKLELERAQAKLKSAQELYQIRVQLQKTQGVAATDFRTSEMDFRVAEADLRLAQLAVEGTRIVAPMDGTVLEWRVRVGEHVAVGQSLGVVADLRRVMAVVGLAPPDVNQIAVGRRCQIKLEGLGETYQGAVGRIDPVVNGGMISVYVTIEPPEKGDLPRPGSSVHVTFAGKTPPD
jgi:beta-lactamase regulating signal transducer with metallopeptidase domain/biotin carboxyl carrier protein